MVTPARFERAATYLRRVVLYPLSYGAMNRLEYISTIGFLLLYLLEKSVKKGSRGTARGPIEIHNLLRRFFGYKNSVLPR